MNNNYNIISNNFKIADYIYSSPISISNLELSDNIVEKFGMRISHTTISRYRKKLPKTNIRALLKTRQENIAILKFMIELFKNDLAQKDISIDLKLGISKEILSLIKELNAQVSEEITVFQARDPIEA